jgi:hypothetical protein
VPSQDDSTTESSDVPRPLGRGAERKRRRRFYLKQFPDGTKVGRDLYSPSLLVSSSKVVSMRSRPQSPGQVRKRSCEWRRTDLNLREGGALLFPTPASASERSLEE